ncbi:hypothetical protein FRC01_006534, partial [Tulasnella sp. 417]
CGYKQAADTSLKSEIAAAFKEYEDACKAAGYPVQLDATSAESASMKASSSSAASSASASATAASSTTSSTKSVSNGAMSTTSRSAAGLALSVVVAAAFGFLS